MRTAHEFVWDSGLLYVQWLLACQALAGSGKICSDLGLPVSLNESPRLLITFLSIYLHLLTEVAVSRGH